MYCTFSAVSSNVLDVLSILVSESIIIILFISYTTVQQQDEVCKKHQKYNHAVADNSTTWLLNTLQCR